VNEAGLGHGLIVAGIRSRHEVDLNIRTVGGFKLGKAQHPFAVRELVKRRHPFRFVGNPVKLALGEHGWRGVRRCHLRCIGAWKCFIDAAADEQQLRAEQIPADRHDDDRCGNDDPPPVSG